MPSCFHCDLYCSLPWLSQHCTPDRSDDAPMPLSVRVLPGSLVMQHANESSVPVQNPVLIGTVHGAVGTSSGVSFVSDLLCFSNLLTDL